MNLSSTNVTPKAFFSAAFACNRMLSQSNMLSLDRLALHINNYWKTAIEHQFASRWHAGVLLGCAIGSGILTMATAFMPKNPVALNPRDAVHGANNFFSNRVAIKSVATFLDRAMGPLQMIFQADEAQLSNQMQMQQSVLIQHEQGLRSSNDQAQQQINSVIGSILQKQQDSK